MKIDLRKVSCENGRWMELALDHVMLLVKPSGSATQVLG